MKQMIILCLITLRLCAYSQSESTITEQNKIIDITTLISIYNQSFVDKNQYLKNNGFKVIETSSSRVRLERNSDSTLNVNNKLEKITLRNSESSGETITYHLTDSARYKQLVEQLKNDNSFKSLGYGFCKGEIYNSGTKKVQIEVSDKCIENAYTIEVMKL
jgi:hypothetical protein